MLSKLFALIICETFYVNDVFPHLFAPRTLSKTVGRIWYQSRFWVLWIPTVGSSGNRPTNRSFLRNKMAHDTWRQSAVAELLNWVTHEKPMCGDKEIGGRSNVTFFFALKRIRPESDKCDFFFSYVISFQRMWFGECEKWHSVIFFCYLWF